MRKLSPKEKDCIQFAIGKCILGRVIVAHTDLGLCAVFLGKDPQKLKGELQSQFPNAILINGDNKTSHILSEIIELMANPYKNLDFVLDERGTPFQKKVWKILREIPIGKTISYTEVAYKMGMPNSVRAVAGACAANPFAIVTPCHRVVRKDGDLSGYRWGIESKRQRLKLERAL